MNDPRSPGTRPCGFSPRAIPLLAVLLLALSAGPARGEEAAAAAADLPGLIRRFAADEASLRQFYPEPLSPARAERIGRFLETWRDRLDALDFDALDVDGQVDWVLLRNHLAVREDEQRLLAAQHESNQALLPFAQGLIQLEAARRGLEPVDPAAAAERLDGLRASVEKTRKAWGGDGSTEKPSAVTALRASKHLARLRGTLKAWFVYRDGYEPEFAWWVRKPYAALDKALADYAGYLRRDVAGVKAEGPAPLIGDPIGRAALERALAREFVPYTPRELLRIAEDEFAWCEREGHLAGKALGIETGWADVVEHVKGLHRPPGTQDDLVAQQARAAIAFLKKHDLVTIPPLCEETWQLEMISAKGQKTLPFAVYNDQKMLVAYATEGMDHDTKLMSMRGNNEHFTRIVTPHELIPGHHLQLYQAKRLRAYRRLFRTPFLVEGWALHWEMLLWDKGWARNPADRVGMLFWRKHRCARILVTLGFHLGELKPQAMIDFLVDRVGLERDGATSEVRRYIAGSYGPLYQCAYMLGGLQMRALYKERVAGGAMDDRAFHDAVLAQNSIPIELIRAALSGRKLARGTRSTWRFQGEPGGAAEPPR